MIWALPRKQPARRTPLRVGVRRRITSWLVCCPVTLGYPESDHKRPEDWSTWVPVLVGQVSQGALASPTETPQVRDTAADPHRKPTDETAQSGTLVMRVKGTENSRSAASMRVSWAVGPFPGKCSRGDRPPEKRTVARSSRRSRVTTLTLSSAPRIRAMLGYAAGLRRNRGPAVAWGRGDHRHQPAGADGKLGGRPTPASDSTEDEQAVRSAPGRPAPHPPRPAASNPPPAG